MFFLIVHLVHFGSIYYFIKMERRSGKRSSRVGSEKMERDGDRQGQMERYFSTAQSPQRAVAPTEEEEYSFINPTKCTIARFVGWRVLNLLTLNKQRYLTNLRMPGRSYLKQYVSI